MPHFYYFYTQWLSMNRVTTRSWKVLCWNVRGLNSDARQRSLKEKVIESQCSVLCLQETKLSSCSRSIMKSVCPQGFDQFVESPSSGASGGLLTAGDLICSVAPFSQLNHTLLLCILPRSIIMNNGFWLMCMVHARVSCEMSLSPGFTIWTLIRMKCGC